jgi:hypothetical protein
MDRHRQNLPIIHSVYKVLQKAYKGIKIINFTAQRKIYSPPAHKWKKYTMITTTL